MNLVSVYIQDLKFSELQRQPRPGPYSPPAPAEAGSGQPRQNVLNLRYHRIILDCKSQLSKIKFTFLKFNYNWSKLYSIKIKKNKKIKWDSLFGEEINIFLTILLVYSDILRKYNERKQIFLSLYLQTLLVTICYWHFNLLSYVIQYFRLKFFLVAFLLLFCKYDCASHHWSLPLDEDGMNFIRDSGDSFICSCVNFTQENTSLICRFHQAVAESSRSKSYLYPSYWS